jgi:hypothetical protein
LQQHEEDSKAVARQNQATLIQQLEEAKAKVSKLEVENEKLNADNEY